MTDAGADAAALEPSGEVDEHGIADSRRARRGLLLLGLGEQVRERDHAVPLPVLVDVVGAERGDDVHRAAGPGHRDREQPLAPGLAERPEVREQAPVGCAAVPDREDDPVTALRDGLLERQHGERLGAILQDEVGEVGALGERGQHRLVHAGRVLRARGDHHQRLARALDRVLHHEFDDLRDLGVDRFDGARDRVGEPVAPHVVQAEERSRTIGF